MAKIKFGVGFSDASGKIGGVVFSKNKNGAYIKKLSKPTNPRSSGQVRVRQVTGFIAGQWSGLTQAQKDSFASQVTNFPYVDKLGETKTYSPYQLFLKVNQNMAIFQGSPSFSYVSEMRAVRNLPELVEMGVQFDQATPAINLTDPQIIYNVGDPISTQLESGWGLQVLATPVLTNGQTSSNVEYKQILAKGNFTGAAENLANLNLKAAYEAVFGNSWATADPFSTVIKLKFYIVDLSNGNYNASGKIVLGEYV